MKLSSSFASRGSFAVALAAALVTTLAAAPAEARRTAPGATRPPVVKPPVTPIPVTPPCQRAGAGNVSRC